MEFKENELLGLFFLKQCSLVKVSWKSPLHLQCLTDNCLSSASFSQANVAKIIQNLDSNKAHDHNNISNRMLKVCGSAVHKLLKMIFKQCIEAGALPFLLEKGIIAPIYKNGHKKPPNIQSRF